MITCNYEQCPAFKVNEGHNNEILRLVESVKSLTKTDKQISEELTQFRAHHFEVLTQQTKQSGMLTEVMYKLDLQGKDRDDKHKDIKDSINFLTETIQKVHERQDTQAVEMKGINLKIGAIWVVASGVAYAVWTKVKTMLGF